MLGLWERVRLRLKSGEMPELQDANRRIHELEDELSPACAHLWLALERLGAGDATRARAHAFTSGLSYFESTGMLHSFDERAFLGLRSREEGEAFVWRGIEAAHADLRRELEPQAQLWREGPLRERVAHVYEGVIALGPSALDWHEYPVLSRLAKNKTIVPRYAAARDRFSLQARGEV